MKNQKGQIVIILLLITLVALSVGLAITQRTLTNLATSTQNEQSSRAFSAADAGIEQAIQTAETNPNAFSLSNINVGTDSKASVTRDVLPAGNQALEYPPIGKETIAQFWLENPDTIQSLPTGTLNNDSVEIYFGKSDVLPTSADSPAIEINAVIYDTQTLSYTSSRYYIESSQAQGRASVTNNNGFNLVSNGCNIHTINTSSSPNTTTQDRKFRCRHDITLTPSGPKKPVMLRIRILYSNLNHPIAVKPTGSNSLPPQASLFRSTGTAGQSQKTLQVFRLKYVVPNFFEFSIFSAGDIQKNEN